jgi:hypothetical protein
LLHGRRQHDDGRRSLKSLRIIAFAGVVALAASACADEAFTVQYAPDYVRAPANVSFFGVYQDGRVNSEAWDQFGVRMAHAFVGAPCEVMYGNELTAQNSDLAGAIDSTTRADGVSDGLLEKISPMAKGDLIVVLAISGHPPQPLGDAGAAPPPPPPTSRYGGRHGRRYGGGGGSPEPTTDQNVFELAATMYSVKAKHSVAVVAMAYTGSSVTDALAKFTAKFSAEMAGSRCVGWSFDQKIDADAIRNLTDD